MGEIPMRMPRHSTVIAYLALFVALGGTTYAVTKIESRDIANRTIKGKDVADDALGGRQVDESKLAGSPASGDELLGGAGCDPVVAVPLDCVADSLQLRRAAAVLVVATGSKDPGDGTG